MFINDNMKNKKKINFFENKISEISRKIEKETKYYFENLKSMYFKKLVKSRNTL